MVLPSNMVFSPLGASGYVASMVGMVCFGVWVVGTLLGLHNPLERRNPVRIGFAALWVASLISYALMNRFVQPFVTMSAADRWMLQLLACTGVALLAAETLRSVADVRRVTRALVWAAAFCGFVAALQYWFRYDITPALQAIPGMIANADAAVFQIRGGLNRVAGTAMHPIELGITSGMILPLALWLAIGDRGRPAIRRWTPTVLIAIGVLASISRSGTLAVLLSVGLLIVLLPLRMRLAALAMAPLVFIAVLVTAKGFLRTLFETTLYTPNESRTDDYGLAADLMSGSQWFGQGGGTYMPRVVLEVFDNQYLKTAVELGWIGVIALIVYLALPMSIALSARRRFVDPGSRMLCAALAGSSLAATVCAVTFDAMAYPQFIGVQALVAGFAGACWLMSRDPPEVSASLSAHHRSSSTGLRST
jgi:hypothetical protein